MGTVFLIINITIYISDIHHKYGFGWLRCYCQLSFISEVIVFEMVMVDSARLHLTFC